MEVLNEINERVLKALRVLVPEIEKEGVKEVQITKVKEQKGRRELVLLIKPSEFLIVIFRYLRENLIEVVKENSSGTIKRLLPGTKINKLPTLEQRKAANELAIVASTPYLLSDSKLFPKLALMRLQKLDELVEKEGLEKLFKKSYKLVKFEEPIPWEFIDYRVEGTNIIPVSIEVEIQRGYMCPVCKALYPARWEAQSCSANGHLGRFDDKLIPIVRGRI